MSEQEKIMYTDETAASYKTDISGWVNRLGQYWGKDEHMARWSGCTHQLCACGDVVEKNRTICPKCVRKRDNEKYLAMEEKPFDGGFLYSEYVDKYFSSEEDALDYCECEEIDPQDLQLVICEPRYAYQIEPDDYFFDLLPEDMTVEDVAPELAAAFAVLNKFIAEKKEVLCWMPGKYRTTIKAEENGNGGVSHQTGDTNGQDNIRTSRTRD